MSAGKYTLLLELDGETKNIQREWRAAVDQMNHVWCMVYGRFALQSGVKYNLIWLYETDQFQILGDWGVTPLHKKIIKKKKENIWKKKSSVSSYHHPYHHHYHHYSSFIASTIFIISPPPQGMEELMPTYCMQWCAMYAVCVFVAWDASRRFE